LGIAQLSLLPGKYSIGAYADGVGWDVSIVKLKGHTILDLALRVSPLAEKFIDNEGNVYENIDNYPSMSQSSMVEPRQFWPKSWFLVYYEIDYELPAKVGEIHSCQYLTTEIDLKHSDSFEVKASINGGPLSIYGYVAQSTDVKVTIGPRSNGASSTIYHLYDYKYEIWEEREKRPWDGQGGWIPTGNYQEVWKVDYIYPGSGYEGDPSPAPYYAEHPWDILTSTNVPRYVEYVFSEISGGGFSVNPSYTFEGPFWFYSGDVKIGASFELAFYTSSTTVYRLCLEAGYHRVYVYRWNYGGGWVLTFKSVY
jgi:hypothetical protein